MLHEFIVHHRDQIIRHTRDRLSDRPWPFVPTAEMQHGVPLFLTQLVDTLHSELSDTPSTPEVMRTTAARHGAELSAAGFTIAQVVHDYGDICQAVTDIAVAHQAAISVKEFHTLNRCLDTSIAAAVTAHASDRAQRQTEKETERLGHAAHELRDLLNSALLAYQALERGDAHIGGTTSAILGRSLKGLRVIIDQTLAEVRLAAGHQRLERLTVKDLIQEISSTALLHSADRQIRFTVVPVDPSLLVDGDPQLLLSAVMNLVHNAFKNTRDGGNVALRAHANGPRLHIEVADECGGLQEDERDLFQSFGERHSQNRSGLGLGLSIARAAVRAHQGDIHIHNLPGTGCVFTIDLPLVAEAQDAAASL